MNPVDVATAFPKPPTPRVGPADMDVAAPVDRVRPPAPDLVRRLDSADTGSAEVVLSAESERPYGVDGVGAVRPRRRIVAYTRTVKVTVRREELEVKTRDVAEHDGVWVGIEYQDPTVPPRRV